MNGTTATSWLLHTLAGGGLLLLLAWAWMAWTRQPARRLRVAEWAVTAALLLAVLCLGPAWLVVTAPAPPAASPAPRLHEPEARREGGAPAPPAPATPPTSLPINLPPVASAPAPPAPHHPAAVAVPTKPLAWTWDINNISAIALALYFVVGAALLGRLLTGWFALRRLLGRCEPVTGRAARLFAAMTRAGRRPRLLASRQARAPFSCGLFRPALVLPAGLCATAPDEVLRWVFAHELAHLERRDAWSALLFGLGQAVYFPVPWFWRLRRQARLCQEYLADAAAAESGGRPEDYAQFLLAWTAAPRPPVGACGVWGGSSDLFWRIKVMLHNPIPLERRCPRRWSLAAACGLLSLAVLAAGVTLKATAAPAPEPNKEEPKKDEPKAEAPAQPPAVPDLPLPDIDDLLKRMPNLDADQAARLREQMRQTQARLRKMLEQQRTGGANLGFIDPANPLFPGASQPQEGRLGVLVEKPSETLIEQLDLPRGQGLIIREVTPDTPAAKAGLKAHDILLEVDGKAVASDPGEFRKTLDGVKSDTPVDVVVLRKGKKETIQGLKLPEAKAGAATVPGGLPVAPAVFGPNFPLIGLNPIPAAGNGVMTTTFRTNDHFTTRHQEGSLVITLTGKVEEGKATANEISVQDGAESNRYESLEKVPEKYRDKVKNLMEMTEKGSVKVDVKAP